MLNRDRPHGRPIHSYSDSVYYHLIRDGRILWNARLQRWIDAAESAYLDSIYYPTTVYNPTVVYPTVPTSNPSGYAVTDVGNLIARYRACSSSGLGRRCLPALISSVDAAKIRPIVDRMIAEGRIPVANMSLTIEEGREDVKNLVKGVDYAPYKLNGRDDFGPRLTRAYVDAIKKRIDLNSRAGFQYVQFDNNDVISDPYALQQLGISPYQWQSLVGELVDYAQQRGMRVFQS